MPGYDRNKTGSQPSTNTEPGAIATGCTVDYEPRCSSRCSRIERILYRRLEPVATAPGSLFVRRCNEWQYCTLPN